MIECFLCASERREHVQWLSDALAGAGSVESCAPDPAVLAQRIGGADPVAVFIDFTGDEAGAAQAAADALRRSHPDLPVIALGSMSEPGSMLAAMRSGVTELVDYARPPEEALRVAAALLERIGGSVNRHGRVVAVLGARAGMGVSTLCANLAALLQKRVAGRHRQVALLDLGLPAGDCALFLNTRCEFSFVDAVRNLHRIDRTFVNTALARHATGLALTTLPANLAELRDVSYASSVGLLNRLRSFFDLQLVDLGGFSNREFVSQIARAADEVWVVCDQGVASVVSAVDLLGALRGDGEPLDHARLIVNQHDPELGLTPAQIAGRLGLPLAASLPSRRVPIGRTANLGKLLVEHAPRDPYVKALDALAGQLAPAAAAASPRKAAARRGLFGRLSTTVSRRS